MWAYLRFLYEIVVGRNSVHRQMKTHDLLVKPNMRPRARRKPSRPKPRPERPNQWWGIDMTKVMLEGLGWVYVVIVLDRHTKKVAGHYAGLQAKTWHWLSALNKAVNRQFPRGVRGHGLQLMADNDCQPASVSFMKAVRAMGLSQAFTRYNNPKGNADTERFMRTLKGELVWINEWTSPTAFFQALDTWIEEYNNRYLHSTLGYKTPAAFEREQISRETPLIEAC